LGMRRIMWPNMRWRPKSPRSAYCSVCRASLPLRLLRLEPTALQRYRRMSQCTWLSSWGWRRSSPLYRCLLSRSLSTGTKDVIAILAIAGSGRHPLICSPNPVRYLQAEIVRPGVAGDPLGLLAVRCVNCRCEAGISYKIAEWRATADEDGHYCFAVTL
jgi:hypothetical protein